jgi:hypothetical protein
MAELGNRQHKRFKVPVASLIGRLDNDQTVDIIDLSVAGIAIKSKRRLIIGSEYFMRLHARDHILAVHCTAVRSRIIDSGEDSFGQRGRVYVSAMRFQGGSEDRVTDFICDALLA